MKLNKTVSMYLKQFVMIVFFTTSIAIASPVEVELRAEQWELSRNGERLLGNGGLADVVTGW
jgi:hypothetical protein